MKILFLTDQTYLHGGIEKVLATKANYLAEHYQHQVYIITTEQRNNKPCYSFSDKINFRDLEINYHREKSYFHPSNLIKVLYHFLLLKKTIADLKPDVIVMCNYAFDFYFLPFILPKIPKVKEFHSSRYLEFRNTKTKNIKEQIMTFLSRKSEKKYHHLVVLNPSEKEFYNSNKISVIPNPIPMSDLWANPQSKKIIAAGRISSVKNFGDLIDIFSELKDELKDWELHFYGENYLGTQEKLQQKIDAYQLSNQIKFNGATNDILETMKEYSIYAMTSETECFPMVLLESLSVGLPIISYNCPTGPQYIIKDNEDGFLTSHKDDFKKKLLLMIENVDVRKSMSYNGKENSVNFSVEKIMALWQKLFLDLQNNV